MQRTKACERCGQEKPATEKYFDPHLRSPDRLKAYCRACSPAVRAERKKRKAEVSREWARNNREKVRESAQRSYQRNRNKRLSYYSRWRKENAEKVREYQRAYAERKRQGAQQNEISR